MRRALAAVLLAVAFLALDTTTAQAQEVRTIPSSVSSDCSKDVTTALVDFAKQPGSKKLQPNGCYLVQDRIGVAGVLDGQGASLHKKVEETKLKQHEGFLKIQSNATAKNLNLVRWGPGGYSPDHYAEHGAEFIGASNAALINVTMTNVRGDCVYMQGVDGIDIKDLKCLSNGRQGGAISRGNDVHIDGFLVAKSARSGFDFEANSSKDALTNIQIENFDFTSGLIAFPSQGYNSPQDNIWIHDGVVRGALSFVYDRQVRPSQDNCRGSVQRKNWRVENVTVDPKVNGAGYGGKGLAVFCGTQNVTVRNLNMPGGEVVMEGSSGTLIVADSCVKGVRAVEPTTAAMIQQTNVKAPPCSGTPPPNSTTTRPPSSSTTTTAPPTTSTTRPPVTTQPALTSEQVAIRDAYIALRAICSKATWC